MTEQPRVLRPRPRRPFELPSNESSQPSTPPADGSTNNNAADFLEVKNHDLASQRTGSLLNLTSSTLLGIFSPTAFESPRDDSSPWGTEVQTSGERSAEDLRYQPPPTTQPERPGSSGKKHLRRHHGVGDVFLPLVLKSSLLFVCGVVYGTIMAHLHENHWITPVKLELIDRSSWRYLGLWGVGGVALASVLPWLDTLFENATSGGTGRGETANGYPKAGKSKDDHRQASRWTLAVRSIGAFVGIAFAMRRLPWESTTQESLTLALVNPFLWYLIDRTKTGFWLSTVVGLTGMGIILGLHPQMIPSSAGIGIRGWRLEHDIEGGLSQDAVAVATWLASVLFSACVCFGNIGRQLALGGVQGQKNSDEKS